MLPKHPVMVKVEHADDGVESGVTKCIRMSDPFLDDLDHVVLKERRRRILMSKFSVSQSKMLEENHLGLSLTVSEPSDQKNVSKLLLPGESRGPQRNDGIDSPQSECIKSQLNVGRFLSSDSMTDIRSSNLQKLASIKVEPPNCNDFQSFDVRTVNKMSASGFVSVKKEVKMPDDLYGDHLDHVLLSDRMKLMSSKDVHSMNVHVNSECQSEPPSLSCNSVASKHLLPVNLKVTRPKKKHKTATDSIETAMEEDAPGLLQVLIEKGVSIDEMKLYGEPEIDEALDGSPTNDKFAELEAVIEKLLTQREPLFKTGTLRNAKGRKATYCLSCLFSLVEQARYLKFRNWPVEWGWCRDLQSFIFVFVKHSRLVLERPEYGYATYFFELVVSLPIDWQIKRLTTAMKLTSCGRVTLLENKALMVGDDLSEGEAHVLMEFGWLPNTGLGTMLNYYDRVVHDRQNEQDSSDWRMKIGKLLMDGFNGGSILSNVMKYNSLDPMHVKAEKT